MRAVTISDGRLVVAERPDPQPGRGELLVRVAAAGINGADLHQVRGAYPAPPGSPPDIPGLELAGEVAAVGPGVFRFGPGDRVMAVVGGGGQAELAVVHERTAIPVPDGLAWPEAGASVRSGEVRGRGAPPKTRRATGLEPRGTCRTPCRRWKPDQISRVSGTPAVRAVRGLRIIGPTSVDCGESTWGES